MQFWVSFNGDCRLSLAHFADFQRTSTRLFFNFPKLDTLTGHFVKLSVIGQPPYPSTPVPWAA